MYHCHIYHISAMMFGESTAAAFDDKLVAFDESIYTTPDGSTFKSL